MRRGRALPFVLLAGSLAGCGAGTSRGDTAAAELQARTAKAEATREHARLVEMEARVVELERRLARQARACETRHDVPPADVESARPRPKTQPLRSQGDFLAEARVAAPTDGPPALAIPLDATAQANAAGTGRDRLQQKIEGLREYASDGQNGLSIERREALRVLLRRERQLDLVNPWSTP